jgi:hypothetical protein
VQYGIPLLGRSNANSQNNVMVSVKHYSKAHSI